jgi:hypothetical protein
MVISDENMGQDSKDRAIQKKGKKQLNTQNIGFYGQKTINYRSPIFLLNSFTLI